MSAVANPTDNAVAERFVRTLKSQLPRKGIWPRQFENSRKGDPFLQRKVPFSNEQHKERNNREIAPDQIRYALEQKAQEAPSIVVHYAAKKGEIRDSITDEIETFRKLAAKEWIRGEGKLSPEMSLEQTRIYAPFTANGITSRRQRPST